MVRNLCLALSCLCLIGTTQAYQPQSFKSTKNVQTVSKKAQDTEKTTQSSSKFGYNVTAGKFALGLDEAKDKQNLKEKTKTGAEHIWKKKYSFGLAPRIAYNIYKNINGYVNFGTVFSKYKSMDGGIKGNLKKRTMFAGLGLEQTFGTMFVRGEFNKVFKKSVSNLNDVNLKKQSYTFKIAGGYRF